MRGELTDLHRRLGATFVYVTHDQVEAMTMADRVALMEGGEVVQYGTPASSTRARPIFASRPSSAAPRSTCFPPSPPRVASRRLACICRSPRRCRSVRG
jgi:ABC-type nitrate/sulfonate/bicarbonate transport system ATPase subunit